MNSLDRLFTITCSCGHNAPVDEFAATPIGGPLPRGSYQCPRCYRAWKIGTIRPLSRWTGLPGDPVRACVPVNPQL